VLTVPPRAAARAAQPLARRALATAAR